MGLKLRDNKDKYMRKMYLYDYLANKSFLDLNAKKFMNKLGNSDKYKKMCKLALATKWSR